MRATGGRQPQWGWRRASAALFPVIKPSPPRRCVEPGSSCQLAPGPLFVLPVVSVMWPVEFLLLSVGAEQLVRQKSLTALWFSRLSDGPAKAELSNTGAGCSDLHSRKKPTPGPTVAAVAAAVVSPLTAQGSDIDKHRKLSPGNLTLNCSFLLVFVSSVWRTWETSGWERTCRCLDTVLKERTVSCVNFWSSPTGCNKSKEPMWILFFFSWKLVMVALWIPNSETKWNYTLYKYTECCSFNIVNYF